MITKFLLLCDDGRDERIERDALGRTGGHALQRDGRAVHFGASNDDDVFEAHTVGVPQLLTELIALGVEHRRDVGAPESRRHRNRVLGLPVDFTFENAWYMSELAVLEEYRNQGIAYQLVRHRLIDVSHGRSAFYVMRTAVGEVQLDAPLPSGGCRGHPGGARHLRQRPGQGERIEERGAHLPLRIQCPRAELPGSSPGRTGRRRLG